MTKVIIHGLMGRMGQEIAKLAYDAPCSFSPPSTGGDQERSDEEGGER